MTTIPMHPEELSTHELLVAYNEATGRDTKRFASRADALRRVNKLLAKGHLEIAPPAQIEIFEHSEIVEAETMTEEITTTEETTTIEETTERSEKLSAAMKKSWADPAIRAKRTARMHVKVGDEVYTSMAKAFAALGLDMKHHVKVRGQMREQGVVEFEGYTFEKRDAPNALDSQAEAA